MLSPRHHGLFWVLSALSVPAYLAVHFVAKPLLQDTLADPFDWYAMLGLVVYGLLRVRPLPGQSRQGQRIRRHSHCLYLVSMRVLCALSGEVAARLGAVGVLLTEDGFYGWEARAAVVHVLASNVLLGTAEAWRQNRRDIEACGMETLRQASPHEARVWDILFAVATHASILVGIYWLVRLVVLVTTGARLNFLEWWFPRGLTYAQTFLHLWLLSPLQDAAETVFYAICARDMAKGYEAERILVCEKRRLRWTYETAVLAVWWCSMVSGAILVDFVSGLCKPCDEALND